MIEKRKLAELPNCRLQFEIRSVSAEVFCDIERKNTLEGSILDEGGLCEDIVFACVVRPVFKCKHDMLDSLSIGQYIALTRYVAEINDTVESNETVSES